MRKILTKISQYLLIAIVALATPLTQVYAKESRSLKKTFEATAGTRMDDTLIYEAQGALGNFSKTINGITLKACTLSNKYGLCLGGTPLGSGPVTFAGNLDDGDNINLAYDITINVDREKKTIVQVYDINISDQVDDKLVYDSLGTITPSVNDEKNGLTLYSGDYKGTYGIHLKGKATQGGTITFSGSTTDNGGEGYNISYNVSVNVDKPSTELKQNFEATVGKRIKSTLIYESATTLSEVDTVKNGITLKTGTIDEGKTGLFLSGKPTRSGTVTLTGTIDEGGNTDINYTITVEVAPKADGSTEEDDADEEDSADEEETIDEAEEDNHVAPVATKRNTGPDWTSIALVAVPIIVILLIVIFILVVHKRKKSRFVQMTVPSGPNSAFTEVTPPSDASTETSTVADSKTEDATSVNTESTKLAKSQEPVNTESIEPTKDKSADITATDTTPKDKPASTTPTDDATPKNKTIDKSPKPQQDSSEAELDQLEAEAQQER